jgi:hypothetical protein
MPVIVHKRLRVSAKSAGRKVFGLATVGIRLA